MGFWKQMFEELKKIYEIRFQMKGIFPKSIKTLRKFYNQENLVGGYHRKLDDVEGEFLFFVCKDENMNDFKKLFEIKKKLRALSGIKDDYNFMHSSNSTEEFVR